MAEERAMTIMPVERGKVREYAVATRRSPASAVDRRSRPVYGDTWKPDYRVSR